MRRYIGISLQIPSLHPIHGHRRGPVVHAIILWVSAAAIDVPRDLHIQTVNRGTHVPSICVFDMDI